MIHHIMWCHVEAHWPSPLQWDLGDLTAHLLLAFPVHHPLHIYRVFFWWSLTPHPHPLRVLSVRLHGRSPGKKFFCVRISSPTVVLPSQRRIFFNKKWAFFWMIICKRPAPPNDHLQEAGPSGWSFATMKRTKKCILRPSQWGKMYFEYHRIKFQWKKWVKIVTFAYDQAQGGWAPSPSRSAWP